MFSSRAWFGGRLVGSDDAFAGAEDAVPNCLVDSEMVWLDLRHPSPRGWNHWNLRKFEINKICSSKIDYKTDLLKQSQNNDKNDKTGDLRSANLISNSKMYPNVFLGHRP